MEDVNSLIDPIQKWSFLSSRLASSSSTQKDNHSSMVRLWDCCASLTHKKLIDRIPEELQLCHQAGITDVLAIGNNFFNSRKLLQIQKNLQQQQQQSNDIVISRARMNVSIGVSPEQSWRWVSLIPNVFYHPQQIETMRLSSIDQLVRLYFSFSACVVSNVAAEISSDIGENTDAPSGRKTIENNGNIVAIGECGLDYTVISETSDYSQAKLIQHLCFIDQISLATQLDLPLVMRQRNAFDDFRQCLSRITMPRAAVHAVVHHEKNDLNMLEFYERQGLYQSMSWLSVEPFVTGRLNEKALTARVPLEKILVQSNAPHNLPRSKRDRSKTNSNHDLHADFNSCFNVVEVIDALAKLYKCNKQEMKQIISRNNQAFFSLQQQQQKKM